MTFRKVTSRVMEVRALTDPKPAFVSIVKAGANQVPFRSVKSDDAPEESNMSERIEAMHGQGYEVARIEFALGETFDTVEAVKAWLDDGGYAYGEVVQRDESFEVENAESTFEEGSVVQIDAGDTSVTIWVGKLDAESIEKAEAAGDDPHGKVTDAQVVDRKGDDEPAEETRTGKGGDESAGEKADSEADSEDGAEGAEAAAKDEDGVNGHADTDEDGATAAKDETAEEDAVKTVIGFAAAHKGGTPAAGKDAAWDAGVEKKAADADDLFVMSAWREDKPKADLKKGDFKFPHHKAAGKHAVVFRALSAGVAVLNGGRGGAAIPSNERKGVYNHLAKHYRDDFDETPPELASREVYEGNLAISEGVADVLERKVSYMDEETALRFDDWVAHFSDALTLGGVLADAEDGIPLGFGEAIQSMIVAMRNNLLVGDEEGARRAAEDFGDLVVALVAAMASVQDDDARRDEVAKRATDLFISRLAKQDEGAAPEAKATTKTGSDDEEDNPVLTAIAALAATVDDNQKRTDGAIHEVKQQVEATEAGLAERVEKLEDERQARRSADATDEDGSPEPAKKGPIEGLALRGALGISNVSKSGGY